MNCGVAPELDAQACVELTIIHREDEEHGCLEGVLLRETEGLQCKDGKGVLRGYDDVVPRECLWADKEEVMTQMTETDDHPRLHGGTNLAVPPCGPSQPSLSCSSDARAMHLRMRWNRA